MIHRVYNYINYQKYQINFGFKMIIVANSYNSIKILWSSKNVKGNNSRPIGYSFHKILSKGIYTIGTTPAGESYKNARKNISEVVLCEKRNNEFNWLIMNESCDSMIDRLISNNDGNNNYLISNDMLREAQYFHLTVALWLTYGFKFNPKDPVHKNLGDEIISVENQITKVRSHIQNYIDYLPLVLKYLVNIFNKKNKEFNKLYISREKYLNIFSNYSENLFKEIKNGKIFNNCGNHYKQINEVENIKSTLMYTYFNDTHKKLTIEEITSECLTMISAGLDNTPLNFKYGLHQLANYHPEIWEHAYIELINSYDGCFEVAYNECGSNMKCEYVKAIVQETLRLFTVLPMALPRETTSDIYYNNSVIPKGTTLFMNCWAGNHDEIKFPDSMSFIPERWLTKFIDDNKKETILLDQSIKHFAFGIGCRMCLGYNFAFRELYILFSKMILRFEPVKPIDETKIPTDNPLILNKYPESLAIEPIDFNINLKLREHYKFQVEI